MAIVGRYLSEDEFYTRLGGIDVVESIESDEDVLNVSLQDAEDLTEAHLIKRYFMPLTVEDTPTELKRIVAALARYNVKSIPVNTTVSESDQIAYDREITNLANIRRAKEDSPSVVGLVERKKTSQLRQQTPVIDPFRQPIQAGRMDGLRPVCDRFSSLDKKLTPDEAAWRCGGKWF